jgi:DNA-binding IclR family transcriptional regulator
MFTMVNENTRRSVSAAAAMAIVAFAGLTLDQGHLSALPQGTVEVGELTPVDLMQMAAVTLPEVVVTGQRVEPARRQVATRDGEWLPALASAAGKALGEGESDSGQPASVLLK